MAGNKSDLFANEEVKEEEAREYAKSIDAEFQLVSALDGSGINDLFSKLAEKYDLIKDKVNTKKQTFGLKDTKDGPSGKNPKKKTCC
ncbi:MAG: hypothetical protein MJ252_18550 [archaeon]|nr:hypothetical protein [archaeon]